MNKNFNVFKKRIDFCKKLITCFLNVEIKVGWVITIIELIQPDFTE
jgi:hypothetical protein